MDVAFVRKCDEQQQLTWLQASAQVPGQGSQHRSLHGLIIVCVLNLPLSIFVCNLFWARINIRIHQRVDYPWARFESACSIRRYANEQATADRKSTRLNSSHVKISYAVFCLKKKN